MSSLPPYNPRLGDRVVLLLAVAGSDDLPARLEAPAAGWGTAFLEGGDHADGIRALAPGAAVIVLDQDEEVAAPAHGWSLVIGSAPFVERALRRLLGMPVGTARLVPMVGSLSVVQLDGDRAVLVRLNDGGAIDALRA